MSEKKRGIIIAAMERYEKLLISNIGYLRNRLKCSLPIEIWQIGQEISDKAKEYLELKQNEWNFTFKYVSHYTDDPEHWKGYQGKPFILKNTKFGRYSQYKQSAEQKTADLKSGVVPEKIDTQYLSQIGIDKNSAIYKVEIASTSTNFFNSTSKIRLRLTPRGGIFLRA